MTAQTDTKLPEWPERRWVGIDETDHGEPWDTIRYERARADAAMARLRVAVEALDLMEGSDELSNEQRRWIREALAAIGPLPLPQMPTPLPGEGE